MSQEYKLISISASTSGGITDTQTEYVSTSAATINFSSVTMDTISATTLYGGGANLTGIITGATNVGNGSNVFNSVSDKSLVFNTITGSTNNKVNVTLSSNTINLDINETNLSLWPLVVRGNTLISGGASLLSGLTFNVTPLSYIIGATIYNITGATTVTLTSGDSVNNRIDVIVADVSGNTGVVTGTAAASPVKPEIDPSTQVEVTFVTVLANSTGTTVSTTLVYNEGVGAPTEWDFYSPASTALISGTSTSAAYNGSKSIEWTNVTQAANNYFVLTAATPFDSISQNVIQFAIKNKIAWNTNSKLRFAFYSASDVLLGTSFDLGVTNSYGFSSSNISSWQIVALPLSVFSLSTSVVSKLRITSINQGSQSLSLYLDYIRFQEGVPTVTPANQWLNVQADDGGTIQAATPTDTLQLSGGTNINTTTSGTKAIVFNLDNNINLTGVTATTISATTYQNLPTDVRVTGGTYNSSTKIATFTNNTGGTFTVSGFSTSTATSFTGGTVTGATNFTGGLSANTISATSIQLTSGFKLGSSTTAGYVLTADANGNGTWQQTTASGATASSRIAGAGTSTTSGNTTISQISGLTSDSTHLIETFVTAKSTGTTAWGTWKRTLAVTTAGTTPTIRFTNATFDSFSQNLSATTVNFAVSGTNINISVSGVTNTSIQWNSAYEIITKSTNV